MRQFEMRVGGKLYRVEVGDLNQADIEVRVNGEPYRVQFVDSQHDLAAKGSPSTDNAMAPITAPSISAPATESRERETSAVTPPAGATTISAPMPGKILSVKVDVGDQVAEGDILFTLEAMKMEMAINSPAAGSVSFVGVGVGQTVSHGDILCTIG